MSTVVVARTETEAREWIANNEHPQPAWIVTDHPAAYGLVADLFVVLEGVDLRIVNVIQRDAIKSRARLIRYTQQGKFITGGPDRELIFYPAPGQPAYPFRPAAQESTVQKPTVGRTVHYQSLGSADGKYPPKTRAAIITQTYESTNEIDTDVDLAVLNPTGLFFDSLVPFSDEPRPGHWSWPPRV